MREVTLVAFGDSITMDRHVEDEEKRWLSVLNRLLSEQYPAVIFDVINSGMGGNSDREKMARFERDVLDHDPDVLLLQFGGNNSGYNAPSRSVSVAETTQYLRDMRALLPNKTQVVLITFPHVLWMKHAFCLADPARFTSFHAKDGGHEALLNRFREAIKDFATENRYPVVDLYETMKQTVNIESLQIGDGVHLNSKGDRLLGELVFHCLVTDVLDGKVLQG